MRRVLDAIVFGTLALVLHLALFGSGGGDEGRYASGPGGAGDEGEDRISLRGATVELEQLVEAWGRAPVAGEARPTPPPPVPGSDPSDQLAALPQPTPDAPAPPSLPPASVPALPVPAAPPQLDTATAPLRLEPPQITSRPVPRRPPAPAQQRFAAPSITDLLVGSTATRRAAGSGGGRTAGSDGDSDVAALTPSRRQSLIGRWNSEIFAAVERGARGTFGPPRSAVVRITVDTSGQMTDMRFVYRSGDSAFDAQVTRAVRFAQLPPAPAALPRGDYSFNIRFVR